MVVGSHGLRSHKAANRQLQSGFLKLQEFKSWRMNSSRCCFSVICFIPCLCGASQHMLKRMVRSQHLLSSSSMQPMQIATGGVTVSDAMMAEKGGWPGGVRLFTAGISDSDSRREGHGGPGTQKGFSSRR